MPVAITNQVSQHNEDKYEMFLGGIRDYFNSTLASHGKALFTTDAPEDLFSIFLDKLPSSVRQHYTCNACRRFVNTYGGVVTITPEGETIPVMWPDEVPELYQASIDAVKNAVAKAKVTGVFYAGGKVWGQPVTGEWHHMSVIPNGVSFSSLTKTPFQAMAEKREDYKTLIGALVEFPIEAVKQALLVLKTDSLYRSEKVLGVAEWLLGVHKNRTVKNKRTRDNLTWLAVATAPAGFCHVKSSMIGTLLEDIVSGLPFETINRRFADKMHPLQYQRPQSLPSAGNIAQAEKIFSQLQAAGSLERRFARLDELQLIWQPTAKEEQPKPASEGVFSHIKPKGAITVKNLDIPAITMTWKKFYETVLPIADKIEFFVPRGRQNYMALITSVNEDAPPILQWDTAEQRNPVSWYVKINGSYTSDWNLSEREWCNVTGVTFKPSMWYGDFKHQGEGVVFILAGAVDKRYENSGNALFPETLKSELHSIRKTIEAYSRNAVLQGVDEASACGIALGKGSNYNLVFRVTSNGQQVSYKLDRWD